MMEIVQKLVKYQWIMKNIDMDKDELLQLKQVRGRAFFFEKLIKAYLFKNNFYYKA